MSAHTHHSSTPASKPVARVEVTPESTPTPPVSELPAVLIPNTESPRRSRPLFAIALAIVGTLPVGLGVGFAGRGTPAASTELSEMDELTVHNDRDSANRAWQRQFTADDRYRAGEFRLALQLYQSKETAQSLRLADEVAFQIGLCHEALGEWDEALEDFQSLSGRSDSELQPAARLAQGRLCLIRGEIHQSQVILRQLLNPTDDSRRIPSAIAQEAQLYLAMACLPEVADTHATPVTVQPISIRSSLAWKAFQRFSPDHQVGIEDSSSGAVDSMDRVPLIEDSHQAEQFLERLLTSELPERLAGPAKLTWGQFAYERGDLTAAAARFESAIGKSSDTMSLIAAYNCGVVQFQREEFRATSVAVGRVVDGARGHELCIPALILRGRAELELGHGEQAAFDLKRAADQSCRDDEQAWATAFMGLAYLQSHKPKLATQALFQRRDRISAEPARSVAAFAVALARFESLDSAEARDRETLFLLRALANLDHYATWFGSCGATLIGRAYRQLGLVDQMSEVYLRALSCKAREPFASEMKLALAEQALFSGDPSQGLTLLAELRAAQQASWSVAASLRAAEWNLSHGRERECLTICQELLLQDVDHAPILRLMGAAYEKSGDHVHAIQCYAGMVP